MNYINKILVTVILFVGVSFNSYSQKITIKDRIKAEHIYNFGVYITWKNKSQLKESKKFQIGVYGSDTTMYNLLKKICSYRLLKWKKIEIVRFSKINEIKYVPILYISNSSNNEVPKIDSVISQWSTLLVTDSCNTFKGTMINFFPRNALKKVEINKKNINARGMKVGAMLYVVAKNYEADWETMLQKSEEELATEKETVEQQNIILKEQENKIKLKEKHILKLSNNITEKEKELNFKQDELHILQNDIFNKNEALNLTSAILKTQQLKLLIQQKDIKETQKLLQKQIDEYKIQKSKIDNQRTEISSQQTLIDNQKSKLNRSIADLKKQQLVLYFVLIVLILFGLMSVLIYRSYRIKKRANKLLKLRNNEISRQNSEIIQQKEEIETQRDEIEAQRDSLATQRDKILVQNKDITDSITYASKIQQALLPLDLLTSQLFKEHFIFYLPRDIVSGDFYWTRKKGDVIYLAVADCTGHGVPGAFMSMLGVAFLNEIIDRYNLLSSGELLDNLREKIIYSLHQTESNESSKDGMDISIIGYNEKTKILQISGANNPVYIVSSKQSAVGSQQPAVSSEMHELPTTTASCQLLEVKGDKMPIGIYYGEEKPFSTKEITIYKNDYIYMFSDGFADQFGGPDGKKFKYKALKNLCLQISNLKSEEQEEIVRKAFFDWKRDYKQIDDILLIGVRFE